MDNNNIDKNIDKSIDNLNTNNDNMDNDKSIDNMNTNNGIKKKYTLNDNLIYGTQKEDELLIKLNKIFNNVLKTKYRYNYYDFYNDELYFELKARRYNSYDFETFIFNQSKIDKFNKDKYVKNNKIVFIIIASYYDKDLYIKYDKDKFKNYPIRINEYNIELVYIPIRDMKIL